MATQTNFWQTTTGKLVVNLASTALVSVIAAVLAGGNTGNATGGVGLLYSILRAVENYLDPAVSNA